MNTVSRSYLEEILTVEHGMGMDGLLRSRMDDLYGILNGVTTRSSPPDYRRALRRVVRRRQAENKAVLQS